MVQKKTPEKKASAVKKATAKKAATKASTSSAVAKKASTIKKAPAKKKAAPKKKAAKSVIKKPAVKKIAVEAVRVDDVDIKEFKVKEGEEFMNEAQREHFRGVLLAWKQQLMADVDSTVGHMKTEHLAFSDPVDRASQEEGFNLELRTRDRERKLIKKIEQALMAIEHGDYGYCEDCGIEIDLRRLEARPTAEKCIDCKTFAEIREKQEG